MVEVHSFKLNQTVRCPADMGQDAYSAKVVHIATTVNENSQGGKYVWITVAKIGDNTEHVWPSNRLMH